MGDHSTTPSMPSLLSPKPSDHFSQPFGSQPLANSQAPAYYPYASNQPRHVASGNPFHPLPALKPSLSPSISPQADRSSNWDSARIIHLQKEAINTVVQCPSLSKYIFAGIEYTEKVSFPEVMFKANVVV